MHTALRADLPDLAAPRARGHPARATGWLREKVQRHGGLMEPQDLIAAACGEPPSAEPLLDYIEAKFGAIYRL
ncbi:MAG: hypothetical protein ACK4GW_14655 [Pseudorhodobacter sp.]